MGNFLLRSQSDESNITEKYLKEKKVKFVSIYTSDISNLDGSPEIFIDDMAVPFKGFAMIKSIIDDAINYPGSLPQLFK